MVIDYNVIGEIDLILNDIGMTTNDAMNSNKVSDCIASLTDAQMFHHHVPTADLRVPGEIRAPM